LVEVLVALSMGALIFLCLSLSLRAGVNAVSKGAVRSQAEEEITCLRSLIMRQWENIYTKRVALPHGESGTFLEGESDEVWYLTTAPVMGISPGGVVAVHIWLDGERLMLSQHPCMAPEDFDTKREYPQHELLDGVDQMRVRYLEDIKGRLPGDLVWKDEWDKRVPPKGLEMVIRLKDGYEIRIFARVGG
jgi:hypothetical protein